MATAAAVVVAKARRDVVSHFMSCNAVTPEAAVVFAPSRFVQRRAFDRMLRSGVLIETRPGRWYLDVARYDAATQSRRKRAGLALGATIAVAIAAALFA